jgi:hypothetical protein
MGRSLGASDCRCTTTLTESTDAVAVQVSRVEEHEADSRGGGGLSLQQGLQ